MIEEKTIYTLGTSNRAPEEFVGLLKTYEIQRIIDVRRFPTSMFDHFKKGNLISMLESRGFQYTYQGDKLGGYRNGGYKSYMETDPFQKALARVERMAEKEPSAIVCAERLPWRCHRRFIANELEKRGWKIVHILEGEKIWEPRKQLDLLKG